MASDSARADSFMQQLSRAEKKLAEFGLEWDGENYVYGSGCNYNPHGIECRNHTRHKIIETDTGKEFGCCNEHLQGYHDYNRRVNREAFVIVY